MTPEEIDKKAQEVATRVCGDRGHYLWPRTVEIVAQTLRKVAEVMAEVEEAKKKP